MWMDVYTASLTAILVTSCISLTFTYICIYNRTLRVYC